MRIDSTYTTETSRIVKEVCYVTKKPEPVEDIFGNKLSVRPTFPYNPESKTAPATAQRWARGWHRYGEKVVDREPELFKNIEFDVTIMNIEKRSEGGRAYKVYDEDMRMFDLREDQVTEAIRHCGIAAGGRVNGKFTWGILNGSLKMVLVGGTSHAAMLKNMEELQKREEAVKTGTALTPDKLQFGHIYAKKDKSIHLFLGKVRLVGAKSTSYATLELPTAPTFYDNIENSYGEDFVTENNTNKRVAQSWHNMTWEERTQFAWIDSMKRTYEKYKDSVPEGYYNRYPGIRLTSSPKFESEEGEAVAIAMRARNNVDGVQPYFNGLGHDLAEEDWARACNNGHRRDMYENRGYVLYESDAARFKRSFDFAAKKQAEVRAARIVFNNKITWL